MGGRLTVLAVLMAVVGIIFVARRPPHRVQAQVVAHSASQPAPAPSPPPMFSRWYGESLRGVLNLDEADAARTEEELAAKPDDLANRLKLMAYYARADRASRQGYRAKRFGHALWLVEHHPESEILHSQVAQFSPGELTDGEYERAAALWNSATRGKPGDAAVQWNAACFFQNLDPGLYLDFLEATAAADPNHPFALRPLAHLYARLILEGGPLARRAQAGLDSSRNVWVLGNAANMFQSQYNQSQQRGRPDARAAELAGLYFERARAIDPNLDRRVILPEIDAQQLGRARQFELQARRDGQAREEEAIGKIKRLPVQAFSKLPPEVARVLRARHCSVPQPSPDSPPRNVIRGEFFAAGQAGWAVLCSVNNSTALLAFRHDRDMNPDTVTTSEDRMYLQSLGGDQIGYSHEITAAGRDFIVQHYRAYGAPAPPPIDHQGIDDAFLEKASVVWYFHDGHWLRLQGAD